MHGILIHKPPQSYITHYEMIDTNSLKRALAIQEQIETLSAERDALLGDIQTEASARKPVAAAAPARRAVPTPRGRRGSRKLKTAAAPVKAAPAAKAGKKSSRRPPFAGKTRPTSPSGPLAPAVAKVIKRLGGTGKVSTIYAELLKDNYVFTSSNPKTSLNARIYRLKGIKPLGGGKFGIE